MNNLTYTFRESNVRVEMVNNEPWFAAKDVCDILELSNPTVSVSRLEEDERTKLNLGRQGETNFVNEYGLYNLIFGSRKPEAKEFKRWVTHEVLPSIRKTGSYNQPATFLEAMELLVDVEKKRLLLEEKVTVMQPKVNYHDNILNNESTMKITQIAKDYGMSATKMNTLLHSLGIQYKQGKTWVLYSKYANEGYTHSRSYEDHSPSTYWTEKGKNFIYETLKKIDVLPLIEGGVSGVKIYQP